MLLSLPHHLRSCLFAGAFLEVAFAELFKGICYAPAPCKDECVLLQDDFMAEDAKALWGTRYRADLEIIKGLGATHVRLYGNNPANMHRSFLDEASKVGLAVIVGISNWPFTQMPESNCMQFSDYNCYQQVKESYSGNLRGGLLLNDGTYHAALASVIVINEPDLKLPAMEEPMKWCKGIISAIDGMLDAEAEANVTGKLPPFTATFSFGVCGACRDFASSPALGQMVELRHALFRPLDYGYQPRNNLTDFYYKRFYNSFNTNNPARDVKHIFLDLYEQEFPDMPVIIQEYHSPFVNQEEDLAELLEIAGNSSLLKGVSFFEYQVRYDKGGPELAFGIFGLGDFVIADFDYFAQQFVSWCLVPMTDQVSGRMLAEVVAHAFGASRPDLSRLCIPSPQQVSLSQEGYEEIASQHSVAEMATFIGRIVKHFGGVLVNSDGLRSFAAMYTPDSTTVGSGSSFLEILAKLSEKPSWLQFDEYAACRADREALLQDVVQSIGWACGNLASLSCNSTPASCANNVWAMADFAFSAYHLEHPGSPMETCYFNGSAIFSDLESTRASSSGCAITKDPWTTALIQEGWEAVLARNSAELTAVFIRRFVIHEMHYGIMDDAALLSFAAHPPADLRQLRRRLEDMSWICGEQSGRPCPPGASKDRLAPHALNIKGSSQRDNGVQAGFPLLVFSLAGLVAILMLGGWLAACLRCLIRAKSWSHRQSRAPGVSSSPIP